MRTLAVVVATSVAMTGCATNSYRIPDRELQRIAHTAPEARGQRVRVIQQLSNSDAPPADRVDTTTQIVLFPNVTVGSGDRRRWSGAGGGRIGGTRTTGKLGGAGGDAKDAAIALLVVAAVALVAIAGVEASRFDGWAQLHPMHPVHLFGKDGGYTVVPLAWIDPQAVAWADKAIVRDTEGPWHPLERHPLDREGPTYGMYGGVGSLRSAYGDLELGPAFTVQAGYFPEQHIGVVGSVFFGWRDNQIRETLFESRYTLELQAIPVAAGPFHAGLYVGAGAAYRFEDGVANGNAGSTALTGGAMLQLDVNTRVALTARFGLAKAHGERMNDVIVGVSVY